MKAADDELAREAGDQLSVRLALGELGECALGRVHGVGPAEQRGVRLGCFELDLGALAGCRGQSSRLVEVAVGLVGPGEHLGTGSGQQHGRPFVGPGSFHEGTPVEVGSEASHAAVQRLLGRTQQGYDDPWIVGRVHAQEVGGHLAR